MGNLQFHPMKVHMLSFWAMVLGASSLLGQVVAPDRSQLEPYRTSCFVVNYTPHPIHLAYLDAYDQLSARETDDTIAPGDTLGYGVWIDPATFVDPLDSVKIVITSDKRKLVRRSVLLRDRPGIQDKQPCIRNVYYYVVWSQSAYYR